MAEEAGPSGRDTATCRKERKMKFVPTVPNRRKKAGDGSLAQTAAEAAEAKAAFQDLIKAAQSESQWQRGRGRGSGRGRGYTGPHQVTFGGVPDGSRPVGRAPGLVNRVAVAPGKGAAGIKQDASAKKEAESKMKGEDRPKEFDGSYEDDEEDESITQLLDYSQYYPTALPISLHHPLDEGAHQEADAALFRQGVPEDLALKQDDPEDTSQQLGMSDLSAAQDLLYLFQLPSVLPFASPAAALPGPADGRGSKRRAAAGDRAGKAAADGDVSSSNSIGRVVQPAASARDLPSGQIGKLLIFQSGKVKLQVGDVLLDVTAGMPCVTRQDVAVVNTKTGHLVQLGPVTQRAVVVPDVWQLMADAQVPDFPRSPQVDKQRAAGAATMEEVNGQKADAVFIKKQQDGTRNGQEGSEKNSSKENEGEESDESKGSSSESGSEPSQQQQQPAAAAAVATRRGQPQQVPPAAAPKEAVDPVLGLLGLPTQPAATLPGKGRFKPACRRSASVVKQEDSMDVGK
eukprot:GHRR01000732.1.p1 GENE.GHRR01000732.1~~GHRR01000732.1.p1  ORF type:complete len:515 (+),score=225.00 GHRR01000732.1:344-1888(+)